VNLDVSIYADSGLKNVANMVAGGNEKDVHYRNVNMPRDFAVAQFADLRLATDEDPCGRCGKPLGLRRGIEVGHIFKLGTKYSESLNATYLDQHGKETLIVMGCYGIGVGRTVAAAIEQNHDKDGIIFPPAIAPIKAIILPVNMKEKSVREAAFRVYDELQQANIDVLLDDRDERPGIKFKDADLIGAPLRITIGPRGLGEGKVEMRDRKSGTVILVPLEETVSSVRNALAPGAV
jgi:prolyl-tRNA synthetase